MVGFWLVNGGINMKETQEPESTDAFSKFTKRITRDEFLKLHPEKAGELDDAVEFVFVLSRPAAYKAISE
jgi:hypothetical protein